MQMAGSLFSECKLFGNSLTLLVAPRGLQPPLARRVFLNEGGPPMAKCISSLQSKTKLLFFLFQSMLNACGRQAFKPDQDAAELNAIQFQINVHSFLQAYYSFDTMY